MRDEYLANSYNIVIMTFIIATLFCIFLEFVYFRIQKIILADVEKKILINDEKICYIPKSNKILYFLISFICSSGISYYTLPFLLHFNAVTNSNNIKYNYIIHIILFILVFITIIIAYCCKKVIITNKRIISVWLFKDSNKIPFHKKENVWAEDISSFEIELDLVVKVKTKKGSIVFLRGLNEPKKVVQEIQNCLNL